MATSLLSSVINLLRGGDLRSIGRVAEVIERVGDDPVLFDALLGAMFSDEPLVQMRAADALEKISRKHPHLLQPHKALLLAPLPVGLRQEVRWHLPLLLCRLALNDEEWERAWQQIVHLLRSEQESRIVVVNAMQGLAHLSLASGRRQQETIVLIREAMAVGSPAVQARGRKLLAALERTRDDSYI